MKNNDENTLKSPFWRLVADNISLQIIVTIIAIVVYTVLFSLFNEKAALIVTSVIFIPVYCFMIYTMFWGVAERERNMVMYGHMEEDLKRGLKAGLLAMIPMAILTVVTIIFGLKNGPDCDMVGIFKMAAAPFTGIVTPMVKKSVFFIIPFMFVQLICAVLGYHNGHKLYRMLDHILYEDGIKANRRDKNQPKRRR